jgi:hypothetical protein
MSLDNKPTDCQPQTHAGVFGREKAVEQARQMLGIDPRAAILNNAAQSLKIEQLRSDVDAAARRNLRHRLYCVDNEIHDHLLELSVVTDNLGKVPCQIEGDNDPFQQ